MIKKIEHFWKGLSSDRTQISALPPNEYGDRFIKFMAGVTMSSEEAERDQHDREAAAAAAALEADLGEDSHLDGQRHSSSNVPPQPSYLPPAPPALRSPRSPEPNPTLEKAMRKATKKEKNMAKEDLVPERVIRPLAQELSNVQPKGNSHPALPVVEESAEAASVISGMSGMSGMSARSQEDAASSNRPFTPSPMETPGILRSDGFTDLGPHGMGGRGPPTPPKSSYLAPRFEGGRSRSGSGESMGQGMRRVISRDSLDKDLPPLPQAN